MSDATLTSRQRSKREHKRARKDQVLRKVRNRTLSALESGVPVMFWDEQRGVYRSPDIAGCFALDRFCGDVKAINLELDIPIEQLFRKMSDNQAVDAMLRWSDRPEYDPEIPF